MQIAFTQRLCLRSTNRRIIIMVIKAEKARVHASTTTGGTAVQKAEPLVS